MSIHVMLLIVDLKHCAFHDIHLSYETLDDAHNTIIHNTVSLNSF